MDQRPDSPPAHQQAEPDTHGVPTHPTTHKRKHSHDDGPPQLRLTSMIDVIFLLLIFFVITANFMVDEGSILAKLPGNSNGQIPPPTPLLIDLTSADDGVTYTLKLDGRSVNGATELYTTLDDQVKAGQLKTDRPVKIRPQNEIRWQHVVNVFNACVRADLTAVGLGR